MLMTSLELTRQSSWAKRPQLVVVHSPWTGRSLKEIPLGRLLMMSASDENEKAGPVTLNRRAASRRCRRP